MSVDARPRVFVSRPAVVTSDQSDVEHAWLTGLTQLGFAAVVLQRKDYGSNPWNELREAISSTHGMLILGFRQVQLGHAEWRPGTSEEDEISGWLASPWNQIEAGLGAMADLPVLVAPEEGVTEGIFRSDTWRGEVRATPIDLWASDSSTEDASLQAWALAVHRRAAAS
jgi:hypothetical protein